MMSEIQYRLNIAAIQNKHSVSMLPDGRVIFFGKGKQDDFCTYVGKPVWNPLTFQFETMCGTVTDAYYFEICKKLCVAYGEQLIYHKHLSGIYNAVRNSIEVSVVEKICNLAKDVAFALNDVSLNDVILAYLLIYYGMVAEENYGVAVTHQRPVCGKVMKMAGLYKHLIQNVPIGTPQNPGACHCYVGVQPQVVLREAANCGILREVCVYRM